MTSSGIRIKGWHVLLGILLILIVTGAINFNAISNWFGGFGQPQVIYTAPDGTQFTNYNEYLYYMQQHFPGQSPEPPPTPPAEPHPASQIQLSVFDYITRASVTTATTTADFCKADESGVFNFMQTADTITVSSTPDQSTQFFAQGSKIIIHVSCTGNPTGGLDYYDGWYYVELADGNPVYHLTEDMLSVVSTNPYKYTVSTAGAEKTGYVVAFTSGTTNYWDIGQLYIYPRLSAANFDLYLTYQGTTLAKVTDGSSWVDTDAEITANATLASTDEDLTLSMYGGAASLGWGWPLYVISSQGEFQVYKPVIIMSTTMTSIGTTELQNEGWVGISDGTLYAEKAFYKVLDPEYPAKGFKVDFSINIPIDSSAAASSTKFLFKFWIIDIQYEPNVQIGSVTTSIPTAYGFITSYGPGAMIQAKAYSTSSGAGTGEVLRVYCTTP